MPNSRINPKKDYPKPDAYLLTIIEIKEMAQRKADFLNGKTTSRPWKQIEKDYNKL